MKNIKVNIVILLFLLSSISINSIALDVKDHQNYLLSQYKGFDTEPIKFDDVYYKGSKIVHSLEWWYFDAVFENGYSIEYHIDIFSKMNRGFAVTMLNIYYDGILISHSAKSFLLNNLKYDRNQYVFYYNDSQILKGSIDDQGNWIFQLLINIDNAKIDLEFTSSTKGWKSKILYMWWWGIIQPKAHVTGSITLENSTVNVVGTGYQEHGWEGNFPFVRGWYWGKFCGSTLNIIWTNVIKYPWRQYLMLVVNQDQKGYFNIPVKDIQFIKTDYKKLDGWNIPTTFHFYANTSTIYLNVTAKAEEITHHHSIGLFNYWRYHCIVQGTIRYNGAVETINSLFIMDLTKFW